MLLKHENISIREADTEDVYLLNGWWNDGKVMEHAGFPNGIGQSIEKSRQEILRSDGKSRVLCIIEIDGYPVGELNYEKSKSDKMEVGWKICNIDFQNKGYGPKIINLLLDFIFSDAKINSENIIKEVFWDTDLENKRAHYVYLNKIKATEVRVNNDSWTDQLGNLRSSVDYVITREQFYKNK